MLRALVLLAVAATAAAQNNEPFDAFFARIDADNDGILDVTEMEVDRGRTEFGSSH